MRLLQVCNVGQVSGGTGACVWTVTRAFPEFEHHVACLGAISLEMRTALAGCQLSSWRRVGSEEIRSVAPDLILLHNVSRSRSPDLPPCPTLVYLHSEIDPAPGDVTVCCSQWLAERMRRDPASVCWQGVPEAPQTTTTQETRALRPQLKVGRICTPLARKWPRTLLPLYGDLATAFPLVEWEFVGCPTDLETDLQAACGGQAVFHRAGWQQRSLYRDWDAVLYHHPDITESFGRVAAEAMRVGCVPLVDDRGGFREQIAPETGFLCASAAEFQMALERLQSPGERLRRSRACRRHAEQQFSIAAFRERLLTRLYETLTQAALRVG